MTTITIIGMGISGNASFCQIINHLVESTTGFEAGITIQIFETRRDYFATGAAYRVVDAPDIWTLNNPAKDFKFIPDVQPLSVWIAENIEYLRTRFPSMNEEYCPRAVVGQYLRAQYEHHKNKAESCGIKVVEHFEEVLDFDEVGDDKWSITTPTLQIESDYLFLCFGHVPADHFSHLALKSGFYTVSTPLSALENIPSDAPVYIIGGQASFVDYALWLAITKNHQGILTSVTRNPSIITTKGNPDICDAGPLDDWKRTLSAHPPKSLSYSVARNSFWETYKLAAREPVDPLIQPSTSSALTYQLAKYEGRTEQVVSSHCGNIDELRSFIKAFYLNGAYEALWIALTDEGKESFSKLMYMQIMAYLTGITPVNTRLLLELYNSGRVREQAGLRDIYYDEEHQEFHLHFESGLVKTEYLIDASGFGYDISRCNTDLPLIRNAVAKGLLVAKAHGGIEMNEASQPLNSKGDVQRSLFCIGPVASFGEKYPTPHASFMVFGATSAAAVRLDYELMTSSRLQ